MPVLPMFPLGQPLLPMGVLPLFLFEPRYLELYDDLVAGDRRFAVVLIERGIESRDDNATFEIGCVAQLVGSAPNEDGTMSIVTVGTEPIRVVRWLESDPYPRAEVETIPIEGADASSGADLSEAIDKLSKLYRLQSDLKPGTPLEVPDFSDDVAIASYQVANAIGLQALDAQKVLETTPADDRLSLVSHLLDEAIELIVMQLG